MKNDEKKGGIFAFLTGKKKNAPSSCCCNFEIEDLDKIQSKPVPEKAPATPACGPGCDCGATLSRSKAKSNDK